MSDLISRQDAIDALSQYPFEKVVNCISIIEELPSAQPYTETEIQAMQDLEQAEIDKAFELGKEEGRKEEPQWIPCSERLPREGVEVVLTDTKGYTTLGHLIKTDYGYKWDAGEALGEISWWYDFDDWNAWMPLPEPWKGEQHERMDV